MQPDHVERRLAAILIADVAGYSRLMGADEEGTLRRLGDNRAVIDDLVGQHRGRVFATAGDNVVVEFASPVAAVRCAVAVQEALGRRDSGLPEAARMAYRIGINLGDVMVAGDNLYGDGVNVAARLEALAEPGGICISDSVHAHLGGNIDTAFDDMGAQQVKNIAAPVLVYRARLGIARRRPHDRRRRNRVLWSVLTVVIGVAVGAMLRFGLSEQGPTLEPSIAVLPFRAIGGDPGQAAFSEGLTDDVITALAARVDLRVMSAAGAPAGEAGRVDPRDVGQRLCARYVLDGSVREAEGQVRITAQLVDAATGFHMLGGRYDRDFDDILAVQEELATRIGATLGVKLEEAEQERLATGGSGVGEFLWRGMEGVGRLAQGAVGLTIEPFRWLFGLTGAVGQRGM